MGRLRMAGLLLLAFAGFSCRQETIPTPADPFDHFPLQPGRYWVYRVDSILYRTSVGGLQRDTSTFYWRYEIGDTLPGHMGNGLWVSVFRYRSGGPEGPWTPDGTLQYGLGEGRVFRGEENLIFIPLVFPAEAGKSWDGHALFDANRTFSLGGQPMALYQGWDFRLADKRDSLLLNGLWLRDVWRVQQAAREDVITLREAEEWYAREVGWVYRHWRILDTQCRTCCGGDLSACQELPWEERAESGFSLVQELISYR